MKTKLLILAFAFTSTLLFSQSQNMAFEYFKTTDGTQNFFYKNITKTDGLGNVYVAGATVNGAGNTDILLAKYNSAGVQLWIQQYAGAGNGTDFAAGLVVNNTDVFLTGAVTTSTASIFTDMITMHYSSTGTLLWATTYNGSGNSLDAGSYLVIDVAQNVYVTGASYNASGNSDFVTVKYSSNGVQQWASTFDYSANLDDAGIKVALKGTNVFINGVVTSSANSYKYSTLTYDQSSGSLMATSVTTLVTTSSVTAVTDFVTDVSGSMFVVGSTYLAGQGLNYFVQKLNSALVTQWTYTYNGASNLDDIPKAVGIDALGNVYLTGYSTISTQGRNITTIKLNSSGIQQWVQTINGTSNGDDEGTDMVIDASSNIYITGYTNSSALNKADYYTVKYNSSGTKIWDIQTDGNHLNDNATNMALDSLNNVIVTGQSEITTGNFQFLTTKYIQKNVITPTDFNGETPKSNFWYYENKGQLISTTLTAVPDVKFHTLNTYPEHYIKTNSSSFVFARIDSLFSTPDTIQRIDMTYDLASTSTKSYPLEQQKEGYLNYYLAHTGSSGVTGVFGNKKILTPDLYPNIDLMYSSNQNGIKYYYIIKPGGEPRNIGITFTGASSFSLNGTTNALSINSSIGSLTFDRPTVYQLSSTNVTVAVSGWTADWQTNGASNKFKFNTGAYTSSLTLVIEVDQGNATKSITSNSLNCEWSTYVGGPNHDSPTDIKSDASNNLFVSGRTTSSNYPSVFGTNVYQNYNAGSANGFLDKYSDLGQKLWSTYVGGSQDDIVHSFDFAANGDIYIVGQTTSTLATTSKIGASNSLSPLGSADFFILQVTANSSVKKWLTYYGGSSTEEYAKCKFDANGNFFIVGSTLSKDLPVIGSTPQYTNTNHDISSTTSEGFIVKFNNSSQITWATYIGSSNNGTLTSTYDGLSGLDFDSNNDLYVIGYANGTDYPYVVNGNSTNFSHYSSNFSDAIISHFSNSGFLKWSSYMGGTMNNSFAAIKIKNDKIYITGFKTPLGSYPLKNSGNWYYSTSNTDAASDAVLAIFNNKDSLLHYTFIDDNGYQNANDIEVDNANIIYISGESRSSAFPLPLSQTANAFIESRQGISDMFIYAIAPGSTNIVWATNIGGSSQDGELYHPGGALIDINMQNKLHLAGATLSNTLFPLYSGTVGVTYFDDIYNSGIDVTITRFNLYTINLYDEINEAGSNIAEFLVYPNPTQSIINVKLPNANERTYYYIYNTIGQIIRKGVFEKNIVINPIEVSNLIKGLYILEVIQKNQKASVKFIKND